jgi:5'-3' exonuclease
MFQKRSFNRSRSVYTMGIPFYFASLIRNHPGITRIVKERYHTNVLGIDGNCLIHRYLKPEDPIKSVLDAIDHIVTEVCTADRIILAMDGLVPYAKIVQQRYRRMRMKESDEQSSFDRNQISPGTPYMKELEAGIRMRFPHIELSSTFEAGEGEHKLFQKMRDTKQDSVCIYGLDADLILLCLAKHAITKPFQFYLLRESGEFNDPKLKEAEFSMMSIWALKEHLNMDTNQYLALSVLCFGNDFMPNLGMFSLREDGYSRAIQMYEDAGKPDLLTFEGRDAFLQLAGKAEMRVLKERIVLRKRPYEKAVWGDGKHVARRYRLHVLDGVQNMEPVVNAFWKTFHWTLGYFMTNEVSDWSWHYPYPDAPLVEDILNYDETEDRSKVDLNFTIADQLAFILPASSLRVAKRLVVYPNEVYTETREPWLKNHDWECEPRISLPWINHALTEIAPLE